jgi:hypothetical protein
LSKKLLIENTRNGAQCPLLCKVPGEKPFPQGATMSFILIVVGKKTYKDLGETGQEKKCAWCSTRIFYHLIVIHTWLTCFFIPLLPHRKEYKIECPVCACGTWIYGKEVKAAKRGELSIHRYVTTANE